MILITNNSEIKELYSWEQGCQFGRGRAWSLSRDGPHGASLLWNLENDTYLIHLRAVIKMMLFWFVFIACLSVYKVFFYLCLTATCEVGMIICLSRKRSFLSEILELAGDKGELKPEPLDCVSAVLSLADQLPTLCTSAEGQRLFESALTCRCILRMFLIVVYLYPSKFAAFSYMLSN